MAIKLGKALAYVAKRAKEPSTYAGLALIAVLVGKPELADTIGKVGQIAGLVLGGGLVAHQEVTATE